MKISDPTKPTLRRLPARLTAFARQERLQSIRSRCRTNEFGCWILLKNYRHETGYAYIDANNDQGAREQWMAHRFTWALVNGEIPEGMHVCHKCDVGACVNPDHLWIGSQAENLSDRDRKTFLLAWANRMNLEYPPSREDGVLSATKQV